MILRITAEQLDLFRKEVKRVYPIEACALLFGNLNRTTAQVTRVVVTPNSLRSTIRFEIDVKAFYDSFMKATQDGLEFIGFFHSHPATAVPSEVDLKFMKLWGDAVWLILSSTSNQFAAFQLRNDRVHELTLNS